MEKISSIFELNTSFSTGGDQQKAIDELKKGLETKKRSVQTLLGVTGSGKTFTIANVIAGVNKNTLIISPNKTLASQLYSEFKDFFPENNVGYFVSFYDYYQPESYIPQTDTYIEKDTEVNEIIEKMRLEATAMLMSGEPTIIVATVSCIYSLGSPIEWEKNSISLCIGSMTNRKEIIRKLIESRYERNDTALIQGNFRAKGDVIDIFPGYSNDIVRIALFGDEIENISIHDPISLRKIRNVTRIKIFPAKHYVVDEKIRDKAISSIETELKEWIPNLKGELEKERLRSRTIYDLEMLNELGYCSGIENYSRHFDNRKKGEPPYCLLDFFGEDFLIVIDESHVTIPQLRAMYNGDHTRKKTLVEYGFRLPSAFDNRPLNFKEFEKYLNKVIYVSATPSSYELDSSLNVVEQLVRPTGLLDPEVEVRSTSDQIVDLISEIRKRVKKNQRILITTITKRMAEDLAEFLSKKDIKVRYLHSEIQGLERTDLIRQLRLGDFDVLVGINLLREGLDIPEVALVVILDADKEGFLRNEISLIQTFGRAARNIEGKVIMYCEKITKSMKTAINETDRRRKKQMQYNIQNKITPKSIIKPILIQDNPRKDYEILKAMSRKDLLKLSIETETIMKKFAEELEFEKAIEYRDKLKKINNELGIIEII
ncbi:MAG: excinuclease ABC subunit UvrB [Nitrososphaeraceae archaeon]